jgi:hypothetical protein
MKVCEMRWKGRWKPLDERQSDVFVKEVGK